MGRSRIRLLAAVVAGAVVAVAVGTHFLLPQYLAGRVEDRLEEHGGHAEVTLEAIPALRLLGGHGDRIAIRGSGLEYDLDDPDRDAFDRLDNFDRVEVDLREVTAGPFDTERFVLERHDPDGRYRIEVDARATVQDLSKALGDEFGGGLGGLIGALAGGAVPLSNVPVPIHLDGELESRDGRVEMVAGGGNVAGVPAGPLAQLVTNAILSRL